MRGAEKTKRGEDAVGPTCGAAVAAARCEQSVIPHDVQPRRGHQRGEPRHERLRCKLDLALLLVLPLRLRQECLVLLVLQVSIQLLRLNLEILIPVRFKA